MTKKLTLNKETLRLLASSDPFEALATDKTAEIQGGAVPKPGRSGMRHCGVPIPGPSGMRHCPVPGSLITFCPRTVMGLF